MASPTIKALMIGAGNEDETRWEQVIQTKSEIQVAAIEQGFFNFALYSTHEPSFLFPPGSRFLDKVILMREWKVGKVNRPIDALWFSTSIRHFYYVLKDIGALRPGITRMTLLMLCPLNVVSRTDIRPANSSDNSTQEKLGDHLHTFKDLEYLWISHRHVKPAPSRAALERVLARVRLSCPLLHTIVSCHVFARVVVTV